jgi:hypothetical protein
MCDKDEEQLDIDDLDVPDIPDDIESLEEAAEGKPSLKSSDDNTDK